MPRAVTPATAIGTPSSWGAASVKERGPALCVPEQDRRTMAAGGTVTMEPPAKMLWRPRLQLQVLAARPHPFCSKPPPQAVLQNPWFRIGQGVGMGTKGLESSISSEVSAWSAAPAHLSPQTPLLSRKTRFYGLILFSLNVCILITRQWIKYYVLFRERAIKTY